jgi:hypothetical protein
MAGQWVRRSLAPIVQAGIMVIAAPTQTRARRVVGLAVLNKRISDHYNAGKFDEAIPLTEKSLDLTHTQTSADHLDPTARMGWLAEQYRNQDRYPEAEPFYKRARAIVEKALGPNHPTVGTPLNNLAELYRRMLCLGISKVG